MGFFAPDTDNMAPGGYAKDTLDCVDLAKRVRGRTAGIRGTRRALVQHRTRKTSATKRPGSGAALR